MKKFLSAVAVMLSAATVAPAFAQSASSSSSSSSSTGVASSADLACMSAAIEARENAVITARADFHAKIMTALTARRDALKAAFTISNNNDRRLAINAAYRAFVKAVAEAKASYKVSVQAAWTAFVTASADCHIEADRPLKLKKDRDDHEKENKGKHLGWMRPRNPHSSTDVNASMNASVKANAKLDLSF